MGVSVIKPPWFDESVILCTTVGSEVHGVTLNDDHDEMAVFIEPPSEKIGFREFDTLMYRTAWERTGTSIDTLMQPRSQEGDTDYTAYSLGKFFRLMLQGNPSICVPLWTPDHQIIFIDVFGKDLVEYGREAVHNKQTVRRFLGYATSQYKRLIGQQGQKNVKRPELIEAYGYDTKYAYHTLRLLIQGTELLDTGMVTLPMKPPHVERLMEVRKGKVSFDYCIELIEIGIAKLEEKLLMSNLKDKPDMDAANEFVVEMYMDEWV